MTITYSRGPVVADSDSYPEGDEDWAGDGNKVAPVLDVQKYGFRPGTALYPEEINYILHAQIEQAWLARVMQGFPGSCSAIVKDTSTTGFVWIGQRAISNRSGGKVEGLIVGTNIVGLTNVRTLYSTDTPEKVGRCGRICITSGGTNAVRWDNGTTSRSFVSRFIAVSNYLAGFAHLSGGTYVPGVLYDDAGDVRWYPDHVNVSSDSTVLAAKGSSYDSADVVGATDFDGTTFGIAHMKDSSAGGDGSDLALTIYDGTGATISVADSFPVAGSGLRRRATTTSAHIFTAAWSQGWAIAWGEGGGLAVGYKDETPRAFPNALNSQPVGLWTWDGIVYVPLADGRMLVVDTQWYDTEQDSGAFPYRYAWLPAPIAAPIIAARTTEGDSPTGGPRLVDMHVHNGAIVSVLTDGTDRYITAHTLPPEGARGWR